MQRRDYPLALVFFNLDINSPAQMYTMKPAFYIAFEKIQKMPYMSSIVKRLHVIEFKERGCEGDDIHLYNTINLHLKHQP
jgi:hypothetical protein